MLQWKIEATTSNSMHQQRHTRCAAHAQTSSCGCIFDVEVCTTIQAGLQLLNDACMLLTSRPSAARSAGHDRHIYK